MYNVLVLGVGGNNSLGILRTLMKSKYQLNIFGACVLEDNAGLYMSHKHFISPYATEKEFIPWLINLVNEQDISIVFSGVEEIIKEISINYNRLIEFTSCKFMVPDINLIDIFQDKFKTIEYLNHVSVKCPQTAHSRNFSEIESLLKEVGFPLIAKPINGKGSNGIKLIYNESELENAASLNNYVIQEYIGTPEQEYTVGCYITKNKRIIKPIIMKRILKNGMTSSAEIVEDTEIENMCLKICESLDYNGPLNVQLRKDKNGVPYVFEINLRFSGTTQIRNEFGFKDIDLSIS